MVERTPSTLHYKPNKIENMEKFIAVKNPNVPGNDCDMCALKNVCNGPCDLAHGYHYERVYVR